MSFIQAVILGATQGLTEFLPISSSGHLVLLPKLFHWADQGMAFDVFLHLGTLLAVVLYFYTDIFQLTRGTFAKPLFQWNAEKRTAAQLILATVPALFVGFILEEVIGIEFRSEVLVAVNLIVWALVLWGADMYQIRHKANGNIVDLKNKHALFIGCAQAVALLPGVSRSGITMSAGLFSGFSREAAVRFSFLLSIPVIALSGGFKTLQLIRYGGSIDWVLYGAGFFSAALFGFIAIHFLLSFVKKHGLLPFVLYRVALGMIILVLFL